METLIKADIFFFITSVAVVVIVALLVLLGYKIFKILQDVKYVVARVKEFVDRAGVEAEDIYDELMSSWPIKFILKKKRRQRSRTRRTEN